MAKEKKFITCDGNEAAAHVSYMFSEVAAIYPIQVEQQQLMETFFVNTMQETCVINEGGKQGTYIVNQKHKFKVCDAENNKIRFSNDTIYAKYNTEVGKGNQVPLWLMGFLY